MKELNEATCKRDHATRCTKCWINLTLKCYAKTFVKNDAQIVEECWRTISYLKGYAYPKLYCKKQLHIAEV